MNRALIGWAARRGVGWSEKKWVRVERVLIEGSSKGCGDLVEPNVGNDQSWWKKWPLCIWFMGKGPPEWGPK
jgi:hypothetical protein